MLKLIIFDLDGTLLNTAGDIRTVLNGSLAKFGLPAVSAESLYSMVGDGAHKLIERAVPPQNRNLTDAVYTDYVAAYAAFDSSVASMYEGEEQALTELSAAGIKFAVLTNKPQRSADNICRAKLSRFTFCDVIGEGRFPLKPDPAAVHYILEKNGIKEDECVMVGDGETDCLTAKNAGIPCISALWGYRTRRQLEDCGATLFARDFKNLFRILQKNFCLNT